MKGYTTQTAIENYILKSIASEFDDQIEAWIESVEHFIDRVTGRNFLADETETERLYDGSGKSELLIDDCIGIEKLTIDGTEIPATGGLNAKNYYLYPANTPRKYKIKLAGGYFTPGNQNVAVEAKWGYSVAVPADIKLVATILTVGIIQYTNKATRSETIGNYTVAYDTDKGWQDFEQAMKILQGYKKHTF